MNTEEKKDILNATIGQEGEAFTGLPDNSQVVPPENMDYGEYDNDSGQGEDSELPSELKGLNWGAFFLGWIWGIAHKTWISFLSFIPYVGFIMNFVLLFKGNEWAWQNRKFSSPEEFKEVQRKWTLLGIAFFILIIVFAILYIYFVVWVVATANSNL